MTRIRSSILLVALSLAGCSLLSEPEPPAVAITTLASPVDLQLGDTARLTVEILNISNETVGIGPPGCNMDFIIVGADGAMYHPAEQVYCNLALYAPIPLSPGAIHRINVFTTGRVVPKGSQASPTLLAPGTYGIRGMVFVLKGDQDAVTVRSDPVVVTFR